MTVGTSISSKYYVKEEDIERSLWTVMMMAQKRWSRRGALAVMPRGLPTEITTPIESIAK